MTDSEGDPPAPSPRRCNWHRVRIYGWSVLIVLALWTFGAAYAFRHEPTRVAHRILAQLPYPSSVRQVRWLDASTLQLNDVKIGDFFYADSIVISASLGDLLRRHFRDVTITGPQLFMGAFDKAMSGANSQQGGFPWTINKLTIRRGTLLIDGGPDFPNIPVRIGGRRPVIINYLKLQRPDASKSWRPSFRCP